MGINGPRKTQKTETKKTMTTKTETKKTMTDRETGEDKCRDERKGRVLYNTCD